jgi:hypothetical protein
MALTSDGVNLAGVRRILQLQEQARQLQAELEQLKTAARGTPAARPASNNQPGLAGPPFPVTRQPAPTGKQSNSDAAGNQHRPGRVG